MTVKIKNTEIRDQIHLMDAEGTSDIEPKAEDIEQLLLSENWICSNIEIWFDDMQGFWRWNCDIAHTQQYEEYLEEKKKVWTNSEAKCDLCGHKWIAVHHIESERLECPRCHNMVIFD